MTNHAVRGRKAHIIKITLVGFGLVLLCLPVLSLVLVRFTDGSISSDGTILLGYDERRGRFQFMEPRSYDLDGVDGPYVMAAEVITVDAHNTIHRRPLTSDTVFVPLDSVVGFPAIVRHAHPVQQAVHPMPERMLAVSDIEGNFTALAAILKVNGVIDDAFRWTFGNGHLVLLGDMVDRGDQVLPVLWCIHGLEQQAAEAGGMVHFILGNHEHMLLYGDGRYAQDKYFALARLLSPEGDDDRAKLARLFAPDTELGVWLRSKNAAERIGPWLFVHAGANAQLPEYPLDSINSIVRREMDVAKAERTPQGAYLLGRDGPLWYRGLVKEGEGRIRSADLKAVLGHFEARGIVIGHSVVEAVSLDHDGRVLRIDVKHGRSPGSGLTQGAWFEGGKVYRVDDLGARTLL